MFRPTMYQQNFDDSSKYYEDFANETKKLVKEVSKYDEDFSLLIKDYSRSLALLINFVAPSCISPEEDEKYKEENE